MIKLVITLLILLTNTLNVFWYNLQIPNSHFQKDINISTTRLESDETTVFDIIQIVNDYLWFAIAWIAMVVLVVGWIKLITAGWQKETLSTANKMIVSAFIAIFVSIVSYTIIKLIVNLF